MASPPSVEIIRVIEGPNNNAIAFPPTPQYIDSIECSEFLSNWTPPSTTKENVNPKKRPPPRSNLPGIAAYKRTVARRYYDLDIHCPGDRLPKYNLEWEFDNVEGIL